MLFFILLNKLYRKLADKQVTWCVLLFIYLIESSSVSFDKWCHFIFGHHHILISIFTASVKKIVNFVMIFPVKKLHLLVFALGKLAVYL